MTPDQETVMYYAQVFAVKIMLPVLNLTEAGRTGVRFRTTGNFLIVALTLLPTLGCSKPTESAPRVHLRPEAKAVNAEKRTIVRQSGQPGYIEAYEQTSIYPKIAGFIDDWKVDIGDMITKDMAIAHLDVPDLVADYEEKKAEVEFDEVRIKVAEQLV